MEKIQMNKKEIENAIVSSIEEVNMQIGGKGRQKRKSIADFQVLIAKKLQEKIRDINNEKMVEYHLFSNISDYSNIQDRADIYIETENYEIIIEIDATRADQVAKKMVSRVCAHIFKQKDFSNKKKLIYVALLYQGTSSMNIEECKKYFIFANAIIRELNKDNSFIGYIMNSNPQMCYIYPPVKKEIQIWNNINEDLGLDAYTAYLYLHYSENSVYQYRRAVAIVKEYHDKNRKSTEECIQECINANKGNMKTYLTKYQDWWNNKWKLKK